MENKTRVERSEIIFDETIRVSSERKKNEERLVNEGV